MKLSVKQKPGYSTEVKIHLSSVMAYKCQCAIGLLNVKYNADNGFKLMI